MGPMGKALGMGKKPMFGADEEEGEEYSSESDPLEDMGDEDEPETDVPPDFQAAYDEWEAAPTAATTYAMIEACKSGGSSSGKPGILALVSGGKGKK
jgi:hypothetical protein